MHDLVPIANSILEKDLTPEMKKDMMSILSVNLPLPPKDVTRLPTYIKQGTKVRDYMKEMANRYYTINPTSEIYNMALDRAIECGELVLKAELSLSKKLKKIDTHRGKRTDLLKNLTEKEKKKREERIKAEQKTKAEIIQNEYKLSKQQAKDISKLEEWAVEAAINQGWKNREIPTRAMALKMIKEKHKKENTKPYNPNAVYMDNTVAPEEVMKLPPIRSTTLCSNVGIDEYYLEYAHVKNCIMAELEEDRVEFYKKNYPNVVCFQGDLFDEKIQKGIIEEHIKKGCKLIISTQPCQNFSLAGKRDFNDPRAKLFVPILNIIEAVDSVNDYVLMENVPPYLTASPKCLQYILEGKTIVEYIKYRLEQLGYEVNIDKIDAANYGTPQSRERVIILASKKGMWKFPIPFKKQITLMEAIGHLPSFDSGPDYKNRYRSTPMLTQQEHEMLRHTPTGKSAWDNAKEYQPKTKEGKESGANRKSRFKRNSWDKPAHTLTSDSGSISGMNTIHPGRVFIDEKTGDKLYSDARVFTLEEKLILLGFPNGEAWCRNKAKYIIPEDASENLINTVLGESFLPRLAAVLAETIPNRTAHPDEKLDDYPQMLEDKTDYSKANDKSFTYRHRIKYPVVDVTIRNYNAGNYFADKYKK